MKVLILSYDFKPNLGGVATVAHEVANSLQADFNHEVTVVSIGNSTSGNQVNSYEVLRYKSPRVALLSIFFCLMTLLKLKRERRFDFAIGLLWIPDGICLHLSNFLSKNKVPYLLYAHGVEVLETNSTLSKRLRSLLSPIKGLVMSKAAKVLCVSKFTEELVKKYTNINNTIVLNNGVNSSLFNDINKSKPSTFTFVTVARLEDYKGVDQCLLALRELKKIKVPFKYKVIGQGPDLLRLKTLCKDLDLNDNVEFLGVLSQNEIGHVLSTSSCFVLLSRADYMKPNVEGFGLVFLEAAACAIPSIAGNSGGVADAVLHNKTGLLVDPTNTEEIVKAMNVMINNQDKYEEMRKQAYQRATIELTWKNQVGKLVNIAENYVRN